MTGELTPSFATPPSLMQAVHDVLAGIDDPEMPVSIVELGMVHRVAADGSTVRVTVLPTFVGCPALEMLRDEIVRRVAALDGVRSVEVTYCFDPAWTPERITARGRERLREIGVTVPPRESATAAPVTVQIGLPDAPCPFCGSRQTRLESAFGPTRCRSIHYCTACKNPFERLKPL